MQKSSSFGETKASNYGYNEKAGSVKQESSNNYQNSTTSIAPRGKGMQLGKKNMESDLINTIKAEEGYHQVPVQQMAKLAVSPDRTVLSPKGGICLLLEEKLSLVSNRDGGIENMEIKGSLVLRIDDPAKAACIVSLELFKDSNIQYMVNLFVIIIDTS